MAVVSTSPPIVDIVVGDLWRIAVAVTDLDGLAVEVAPVVTVTLPDGSTTIPIPEAYALGGWVVDLIVVDEGRHVARVVSPGLGAADFAAYAAAVVDATGMPTVAQAKVYLKIDPGNTARDQDIQDALTAEAGAQRDVCRVPAAYPPALREALLRRVARNLALRLLPLAVLRGDGEAGDTILPGRDPEVKRLEAPHRKVRVG